MKLEDCIAPPPPEDAKCHYCGGKVVWQFFWLICIPDGQECLHLFHDTSPVYVCKEHNLEHPVIVQKYITPKQFQNELTHIEYFKQYWSIRNRFERLAKNMFSGLDKPNPCLYIGEIARLNWNMALRDAEYNFQFYK